MCENGYNVKLSTIYKGFGKLVSLVSLASLQELAAVSGVTLLFRCVIDLSCKVIHPASKFTRRQMDASKVQEVANSIAALRIPRPVLSVRLAACILQSVVEALGAASRKLWTQIADTYTLHCRALVALCRKLSVIRRLIYIQSACLRAGAVSAPPDPNRRGFASPFDSVVCLWCVS